MELREVLGRGPSRDTARVALAANDQRAYPHRDMKPVVNLEETPGKVVGRRQPPADGLTVTPAQEAQDARAWKNALRTFPIPKGVYRFRTHEEADEWLWRMLTRPRPE